MEKPTNITVGYDDNVALNCRLELESPCINCCSIWYCFMQCVWNRYYVECINIV